MPPVLLSSAASHTALSELADRAPVPVDLDSQPEAATSLAPAVETTVYFVAAEALTNALKHAERPRLGISLGRTDDVIRLEVRDDGRGGARLGTGSGPSASRTASRRSAASCSSTARPARAHA